VRTDSIGFDSGDVNFYEYTEDNPANNTDPLGLTWTVHRAGNATAVAVGCDDTVNELAKRIGLESYKFKKWLTSADDLPLPVYSNERMRFRRFYIPNTIYAYWAGNFLGAGRWWMNWNAGISYLKDLGFQVLETRHTRGEWFRMNDDIQDLLEQKTLHGVYFSGHGATDGLYAGYKWRTLFTIKGKRIALPVGFVKYGDPGEQVLDYLGVGVSTAQYYHLALGLIFACYSNSGKDYLVGRFSRSGVIWEGDDDIFWVTFEKGMMGPYYDPDADVPRPFHVKHWIRPGDQETQKIWH
jgi:hypothetical protein